MRTEEYSNKERVVGVTRAFRNVVDFIQVASRMALIDCDIIHVISVVLKLIQAAMLSPLHRRSVNGSDAHHLAFASTSNALGSLLPSQDRSKTFLEKFRICSLKVYYQGVVVPVSVSKNLGSN